MKMKKIFSSVISMVTAVSLLAGSVSASWDLDEQQAVEGDISSFVQVEEVTFGEPEPIEQPLAAEEELYQMEWMGELFDVEASGEEIQPMADLPDLSVRNLQIKAGDMTSPYPAGMLMYYTFQLLNYGTADANGAEVIIKLDGEVATNPVSMGNVPAGKGGNIQFRGPEMSPGSHTMEIVVNPDRKIVESNYNNNTTSSTFTYKACFELVAVSMTSHKQTDENTVPTYEVGESVTFTMDFQNSGLLDVQNVPIALYGTFREPGKQPVTSQMGYTNYIAKLPAKTRMKATVSLTFTKEASARISFVLDPEKILGDMDYNNNTAETNLKVSGGTDKKYALCIGVNRDSGDESGNFLPNVQGAHKKFTDIGIDSTLNGSPNIDFLLSVNAQNNKKQLASDILFFNGHASPKAMCFRSNQNNTGIRYNNTSQVVLNLTYDGIPEEVAFAGIRSVDFQNVELVSFIGCSTGVEWMNDSTQVNSIAEIAHDRGAKASLGFTDSITSRSESGRKWVQDYVDSLCAGYTFQEALELASENLTSNLAKYFIPFGDINYRMVENTAKTRSVRNESNNLIKKAHKLEHVLPHYNYDQVKASECVDYQELYDLIKSVDSSFDSEDYYLSTNFYSEELDSAIIRLQYYIEDKISTSKMYNIIYRDGEVTAIVKLPSSVLLRNEEDGMEENLLTRIQAYEKSQKERSIQKPNFEKNVNVVEEQQVYYYDYQTNELKDIHTYTLEFPEEDNTRDLYEQEILIP